MLGAHDFFQRVQGPTDCYKLGVSDGLLWRTRDLLGHCADRVTKATTGYYRKLARILALRQIA